MNPSIHPVTVGTFHTVENATLFQQALKKRGIDSHLHDERFFQRIFLLSSPRAGLHVKVEPTLVEMAEDCLSRWETSSQKKAVHCPRCNSSRVEYPQLQRDFITTSLLQHLAILFRFERRSYHCKHCEHTWRRGLASAHPKPTQHEPDVAMPLPSP